MAGAIKRLTLYHGTTTVNAANIMINGFDLRRVKPRWQNDYAVSTLTSGAAVRKYFTRGSGAVQPGMTVLAMQFNGLVLTYRETQPLLLGGSMSPQDYTRRLLAAGVDAIVIGEGRARQVFIYNVHTLSNIRAWKTT